MLKIGSHVSMSGNKMFLGSVEETIRNGANSLMVYTGAPQNTKRKPIDQLMIEEAHKLMAENDIEKNDLIIHAPYIINLGNTLKKETYEIGVSFLKEEIKRSDAMEAYTIVLHPGAHVGAGVELGLDSIVKGLNEALSEEQQVIVALETMAGKGTEIGRSFEELKYIIDHVDLPDKLGVCLDTCHIHDAGYDLSNVDELLEKFDQIIGLEKITVVHVNDSINECGAKKDRHANIGYGKIGFETLVEFIYHPKLKGVAKILETPYVNDKKESPYAQEIKMIKEKKYEDWIK